LITLLMVASSAVAWYPEYSVMASDFVVGQGFFGPVHYQSMSVYALGAGFRDFYDSPLDNIGNNPAAGLQISSRHFFHLDLGGQQLFNEEAEAGGGIMPMYDYYYPGPWSYYQQNEEKVDYDPAFRLVYLGYPLPVFKHTRLGLSVDWMYELSQFYQPYDMWGFGYRDAFGAEYASDEVDPYDDYRLKQAGDDENVNEGYNISFFLAHLLSSKIDIGLRYTLSNEAVDGNLRDYDFNDQSDYRDEYLSFYESITIREQAFTSSDLMLGINTHSAEGSEFGISAGILTGELERIFDKQDSSRYFGMTYDQYPDLSLDDSTYYSSTSNHQSGKNWRYTGQTIYGGLQYGSQGPHGINYRIALYTEQRQADLTEEESLFQSNNYNSKYFYLYDSTVHRYSSTSWASIERTGTGKFEQSMFRGSAGIDWTVSPGFSFLGGLYVNGSERLQTAREPFSGEKYSYYDRTGNRYNPGIQSTRQTDEKIYSWRRSEQVFTVGLPVGVVLDFADYFQLQSGLTKIYRKTEITESYDVIVAQHLVERNNNGIITVTTDEYYVDGYEFPDIKTFDNDLIFNAGLSFVFVDNFAATVVFSKAFTDDYYLKIGGQISW